VQQGRSQGSVHEMCTLLSKERVNTAIHKSQTKQRRKQQCQQEKSKMSFADVLGVCTSLNVVDTPALQVAEEGLMAVGSDGLAKISSAGKNF
jgi:hypothetical protein